MDLNFTVQVLPGFNLDDFLTTVERQIVVSTILSCNENKSQAARLLGVNRTTLVEKMRRLGLKLNPPPTKKERVR